MVTDVPTTPHVGVNDVTVDADAGAPSRARRPRRARAPTRSRGQILSCSGTAKRVPPFWRRERSWAPRTHLPTAVRWCSFRGVALTLPDGQERKRLHERDDQSKITRPGDGTSAARYRRRMWRSCARSRATSCVPRRSSAPRPVRRRVAQQGRGVHRRTTSDHAFGGVHFLVEHEGPDRRRHASVVATRTPLRRSSSHDRATWKRSPRCRAASGVAIGSALMAAVGAHIDATFELGALDTGIPGVLRAARAGPCGRVRRTCGWSAGPSRRPTRTGLRPGPAGRRPRLPTSIPRPRSCASGARATCGEPERLHDPPALSRCSAGPPPRR